MNITGKQIVDFLLAHPGCIKESLYPDDPIVIDESIFLNPDDWYCDIADDDSQSWINEASNNWCDGLVCNFYVKELGYGGYGFYDFSTTVDLELTDVKMEISEL